jgi:hypothetical protein
VRNDTLKSDGSSIKMAELGWHNCSQLPRSHFVAEARCSLTPSRFQPFTPGAPA